MYSKGVSNGGPLQQGSTVFTQMKDMDQLERTEHRKPCPPAQP